MIKGILLTIFLILLAVTIAGVILFAIKAYKNSQDGESLDDIIRQIRREADEKKTWVRDPNQRAAIDEERDQAIIKAKASYVKPKNPAKAGLTASIASFVAMLGLVIAIPASFHQVEAGTYAVVKELGKITEVRTPGTYFDFYMTRLYEVYDATVQQVEINTQAYSKDGQTMGLEVYLQYQIQLDKLIIKFDSGWENSELDLEKNLWAKYHTTHTDGQIIQTEGIAGKYITLASLQARIETQTIEKTKAVMSSAEAMEIIQNRKTYSDLVSSTVRDAIGPDYYVNVQDVVLTDIEFTDEFEKSVEDKVIAEQQKQAAITRAEAELEVAKLEAQRKIEEAKGNAEAQKIIAKAAAEAATYNIIELARTVGYTVNAEYEYKTTTTVYKYSDPERTNLDTTEISISVETFNEEHPEKVLTNITFENPVDPEAEDARWIKTEEATMLYSTRYAIDLTTGPGEDKFKSLVEDYLAYLEYLKKWNGELPDVVAGDDAISIIVPNTNG